MKRPSASPTRTKKQPVRADPKLPTDPAESALGGFLHAMTLTSTLAGPQVPLGTPVTFSVAAAEPGVQLPLAPNVPTTGQLLNVLPAGNVNRKSVVPTVLQVAPHVWVEWSITNEDGTKTFSPGDTDGVYDYHGPA